MKCKNSSRPSAAIGPELIGHLIKKGKGFVLLKHVDDHEHIIDKTHNYINKSTSSTLSADFSNSAKTVQLISCRSLLSAVRDDKLVIRRCLIKEFRMDLRCEEMSG